MNTSDNKIIILLADDDEDDCLLFEEALRELKISTQLSIVHDGDQLMCFLKKNASRLPHILFMDLNMPRKNGFECLTEIKLNKDFEQLYIIISSTSSKQEIVNLVYDNGAHYYIVKPANFDQFKLAIFKVLSQIDKNIKSGVKIGDLKRVSIENFVLIENSKILSENPLL